MNRTHTACCALIASALVLAGLLAVCVGQRTTANEAHAEMVIAGEALTMMTLHRLADCLSPGHHKRLAGAGRGDQPRRHLQR